MTEAENSSPEMTLANERSSEIHLHSSIPEEYRQELEDLFFFNPKQAMVRDRVRQHVERYGTPAICCREGLVSLELSRVDHAQALFIMRDKDPEELIGILLYVREGACLKVLYMALTPDCTTDWCTSGLVISQVLDQLRRLARNIKGVCQIEFALDNRDVTVKV